MRAFQEIASDFCGWVEAPAVHSNLLAWLPQILAELLHGAFHLHDDGLSDAGAKDFARPDYMKIRHRFPPLPVGFYSEVSDPMDLDGQPVTADLCDDLADIYLDLSEGLFLHRHASPEEAERYWSQSFRYHWGEHATGALRAVYSARRQSAL